MTTTLAPEQDEDFYPTGDGKPMAETDLHREQMNYLIFALASHFRNAPDVYVSGNNFLYYEQGNPRAVVSPDGYVVFGVPNHPRDTYMLWLEGGITPAVVFEVTSKKTKREDTRTKRPLYEAVLRVPEYFQFDPTGDYLRPRLQGLRLVDGQYQAIPLVDGGMHSEQLGLDLVQEGRTLRLFDPIYGVSLLSPQETRQQAERETSRADRQTQRAEQEAQRADQQTQRAEQEAQARTEAEAEIARLRAELAALRQQ